MWVPKATHICQIKNQLYVVIKKLIAVACKCSFTKKKHKEEEETEFVNGATNNSNIE
jgi:hypothetical protein